jgi:hypothetical protein
MPTPVLNNATPVFRLLNTPPEYSFLRTFGCACWPSLRKYNSRKLEFRSKMCVFLGYSPMHKGYKCLDRSTRRIYISRDVVFDEKVFPFSTPGVVVDVSKLIPVSFPSTEPVTQSTDTRSYDITLLPVDAPVSVGSPVQVPLRRLLRRSTCRRCMPRAACPTPLRLPRRLGRRLLRVLRTRVARPARPRLRPARPRPRGS